MKLQRAWSGFDPDYLTETKNGFRLDPSFGKKFEDWNEADRVVLIGKHLWYYLAGRVASCKGDELFWHKDVQKCTTSGPVLRGNHNYVVADSPLSQIKMGKTTAIENAYELLTDEGEWYLSAATRTLYLNPPSGFSRDSKVICPKQRILIKLDGTLGEPISNVIIENLHFRFNDGDKMSFAPSYPTESVFLAPNPGEGALQINACRKIRVQNTNFKHIGNEALNLDLGGENITLRANAFEKTDGTAISIVQSNLVMPETWWEEISPENANKVFKNVVVSNNYLRNVVDGNFRFAHAIAYSELAHGVLITHNEVDGAAGAAVRNTWRYGAVHGGHAQGIVLSWNRAENFCKKPFTDFSGLYIDCANGRMSNSIHHNYVRGVGTAKHNHPIYLDVRVENTDVSKNVLAEIPPSANPILGPCWVVFIGSRNNRAFRNWIEGGNRSAQSTDTKTVFWFKKRNLVFDNTFYQDPPSEWPTEAQEVIDGAGLEPGFRYITEYLDT